MRGILVANPKGGCGKSTLATNLAGYYAGQGKRVLLADADRQRSALSWLSRREAGLPLVNGAICVPDEALSPPSGTDILLIDSPAGLHGKKLAALLRQPVERVLVPL